MSDMSDAQLTRLQNRFARIPKALSEGIKPALTAAGQKLVDAMKAAAESSRKTGAVVNSITFTTAGNTTPLQPGGSQVVPDNAVTITAGDAAARYAHFVEYGTSKMAAEPFFWPTYRALRAALSAEIKATVLKAIEL